MTAPDIFAWKRPLYFYSGLDYLVIICGFRRLLRVEGIAQSLPSGHASFDQRSHVAASQLP